MAGASGAAGGRSPAHKHRPDAKKERIKDDSGCAKTSVFITATLIALGGVLLVVGGVVLSVSRWSVFFGKEAGYAVSIMGGLVLIIAMSGGIGAARHNRCCLLLYVLFLGIALLVLLALGPIYLVQSDQFDSRFETLWCDNIGDAAEAQTEFDCCGYNCPADKPAGTGSSPCPPRFVQPVNYTTCDDTLTDAAVTAKCDAYAGTGRGCKQMALDWMDTRFIYIFALCLAVAITSCVGIGTACAQICLIVPNENKKGYMVDMMANSIRRIQERVTSERDFHEERGSARTKKHAKSRPPPSAVVVADGDSDGRQPRRSGSSESRGRRPRRSASKDRPGRSRSRSNSAESHSRRSGAGSHIVAPAPTDLVDNTGPRGPLATGSLGDSDLELERALAAC